MEIQGKEIIAGNGKYIHRKGSDVYFTRGTLLQGETLESFEEVSEKPDPMVEEAKQAKIAEIEAYDKSGAVNSVYLNDMPMWSDKNTRVGLVNSTNAEVSAGNDTTTLWLGTVSMTFTCTKLLEMLADMELYALKCFNKTAEHKRNVQNLSSVEEVTKYDYTTGYPDKPKFKVQ